MAQGFGLGIQDVEAEGLLRLVLWAIAWHTRSYTGPVNSTTSPTHRTTKVLLRWKFAPCHCDTVVLPGFRLLL